MELPLTRGQKNRQAILDAAYSLFIEQGFQATSIRQIARRSKTSQSGIYNHFESKEQIFETVMLERHPFRRMVQILQDTPGETLEAFIENAARSVISELRSQPDSLNLVLIGITEFKGRQAPELARVFLPQSLALFERFRGAQGQLRDLPAQTILLSFLSTVIACYLSTNLTNPSGANFPDLESHG